MTLLFLPQKKSKIQLDFLLGLTYIACLNQNANERLNQMNIMQTVAERIKTSGPVVSEAVVSELVQREITKRTQMVVKGFDALDKANKDLAKIKPDQQSFGADGVKVNEFYSKAKIDELNKAKSVRDKLEKALNKALGDQPDYSELSNLIGGDKGGDKSPTE